MADKITRITVLVASATENVNWLTGLRVETASFAKFILLFPSPLSLHRRVIIGNIGYIEKRKARKRDDNERRETKFAVERGNYKELGEAGGRERERGGNLRSPGSVSPKGSWRKLLWLQACLVDRN